MAQALRKKEISAFNLVLPEGLLYNLYLSFRISHSAYATYAVPRSCAKGDRRRKPVELLQQTPPSAVIR
jgi:hypothetical protein